MAKKEKEFPIDTFGGRIQYRRTKVLKLSRAEFYDLIHPGEKISRESKNRTIKNWESGQNDPDLATLRKICAILNCSADYLLGFESQASQSAILPNAQTGLTPEAARQLRQFSSNNQGRIRLSVINYLLSNIQFVHIAVDKMYDYYLKYATYADAEETYSRERRELDKLTGGDLVKEIELLKSGAVTQTMSRRVVAELKDIAEAARFKIQKDFDVISEDMAKKFYHQKATEPNRLFNR